MDALLNSALKWILENGSTYLQDLIQNLSGKKLSQNDFAAAFVKGLPKAFRNRLLHHAAAKIIAKQVVKLASRYIKDKAVRRRIEELLTAVISGLGAGVADVGDQQWEAMVEEKNKALGGQAADSTPAEDKSREMSEELVSVLDAVGVTLTHYHALDNSLSVSSPEYRYTIDKLKDIFDVSKVNKLDLLNKRAKKLFKEIQEEGPFEDMLGKDEPAHEKNLRNFLTALEISGADLEFKNQIQAYISPLFPKEKDKDGNAVPRNKTLKQSLFKYGLVYPLAVAFLLAVLMLGIVLLTLMTCPKTAIIISVFILSAMLVLLGFWTAVSGLVLEAVQSIFVKVPSLDQYVLRKTINSLVLALSLVIVINITVMAAEPGFFLRLLMLMGAGALALWYRQDSLRFKSGVIEIEEGKNGKEWKQYLPNGGRVPLIFTGLAVALAAFLTYEEAERLASQYPLRVAWKVEYKISGAPQKNTFVVPLPSGKTMDANQAFETAVYQELWDWCENPHPDNKAAHKQLAGKSEDPPPLLYYCFDSASRSVVHLPKGVELRIPGVIVRAEEKEDGNIFFIKEAKLNAGFFEKVLEKVIASGSVFIFLLPGLILLFCLFRVLFSEDSAKRRNAAIVGGIMFAFILITALVTAGVIVKIGKTEAAPPQGPRKKKEAVQDTLPRPKTERPVPKSSLKKLGDADFRMRQRMCTTNLSQDMRKKWRCDEL